MVKRYSSQSTLPLKPVIDRIVKGDPRFKTQRVGSRLERQSGIDEALAKFKRGLEDKK